MSRCPCGVQHSGPRAPFDLAAALTMVLERDAKKPDAAVLRTHVRCLLAELRGLCASCTFTLAAEMAQAARADVQATAQAVASHARDLVRDFYSAVEPRKLCGECGGRVSTDADMKKAHDLGLPDETQPWERELCWANTPDGPHATVRRLPRLRIVREGEGEPLPTWAEERR